MSGRRSRGGLVPRALVEDIMQALSRVDDAMEAVEAAASAPWEERRERRRALRASFDAADALLRQATALTRGRSHGEWSRWRHRLSRLSLARQVMLFAESDDLPVLGLGSVRAVDTGMAGPAIGELQHGESAAPGAPATYGLDLEAVLASPVPGPDRRVVSLPLAVVSLPLAPVDAA